MVKIMQLTHLSESTKLVHTERLFFKKFAYKICFVIDCSELGARSYSNTDYWLKRSRLRTELRNQISANLDDHEYRTRQEGNSVSFFLNSSAIVDELSKKFKDSIIEIHMPLNDEHTRLMQENHRIRIRNTLFYDKYRYKVNIKSNNVDRFDDLKTWLYSLETDKNENRWMPNSPLKYVFNMSGTERKKPRFSYRYSSFAVFLNDEQDVMMLQLYLNDWYLGTEKAVLVTEI